MLTEDQKKLIEENRRKALEKLSHRSSQPNSSIVNTTPAPAVTAPRPPPTIVQSNAAAESRTIPNWDEHSVTRSPVKAYREKIKLQIETTESFSCTHAPHLNEFLSKFPGSKFVQGKPSKWMIPLASYSSFCMSNKHATDLYF